MVCEPVHIAHWGTFVTTPRSTTPATVRVRTRSRTTRASKAESSGDGGRSIRRAASAKWAWSVDIPAGGARAGRAVPVKKPQRWDVETPEALHRGTRVLSTKPVDSDETPFGIRTFEFTADDGFHLNGRRVQL